MITDESLTVSDAVQWCAGAISHREAARLRQLTAQAEKERAEKDGTTAPNIDDRADMRCKLAWGFGQLPQEDALHDHN